jgi:NCAIR mutase (PurE)-related protein
MNLHDEVTYDFARRARIGLSEAVLCEGKSVQQIQHILTLADAKGAPLLLTRLDSGVHAGLGDELRGKINFDPISRTAILGPFPAPTGRASVAIVSAGTSDAAIVREASRTLAFHGEPADVIMDIGVAGLWRVLEKQAQLRDYRVVIVVAGMDGALFSVIGGLVGGLVIAVPAATGYGTAHGGMTALNSALSSCAPGVVVVNVGNGYGGACAALRALRSGRGAPDG